jgi:hypothetical protein
MRRIQRGRRTAAFAIIIAQFARSRYAPKEIAMIVTISLASPGGSSI